MFVKQLETAAAKIKADETWWEAYMQSLLRDQDKFEKGREEGLEEGRKEIAEITELPIEEVKKLETFEANQITDLRYSILNEKNPKGYTRYC